MSGSNKLSKTIVKLGETKSEKRIFRLPEKAKYVEFRYKQGKIVEMTVFYEGKMGITMQVSL